MNEAARVPGSAPEVRAELKYCSSVFLDGSSTRRQPEQVSIWRCDPPSTDVGSRPSKYQQIKWIVSLQLITPSLRFPKTTMAPVKDVHFPRQTQASPLKMLS